MSIELQEAPAVRVVEDEQGEHDHDSKECHIYRNPLYDLAYCGLPSAKDMHRGCGKGDVIPWKKGMTACPVCGMPLCVNCLLAAS